MIMLDNPQLAAALPRLPEQWRDMLYLHFYEYYTYKKISEIYRKNRTTISSYIKKSLRLLHEEMEVVSHE